MTKDFHDAMKIRTLRDQQTREIQSRNQQIASDRVMNTPKNYDQIQDIKKSDFFKTVNQTLKTSREKQFIQNSLEKTLNNLTPDQINNFKEKI